MCNGSANSSPDLLEGQGDGHPGEERLLQCVRRQRGHPQNWGLQGLDRRRSCRDDRRKRESGLVRVSAESLRAGNPFDMRIRRGANEIGGKCVELRRGPDMGSKRS
jgi:hypothetical protein